MKKFALNILLFALLFVLANFVYLKLIQKVDWNFKKYIEAQSAMQEGYKTLVLGNSLAMDGINTEMIGNAYNAAIGGASLETSLYQMEAWFKEGNSLPETVLMCLGSNIDPELKKENLHPILRYCERDRAFSFYNLPMIQFRWMALEMIKKVVSKQHRQAHLVQGQLRILRTVTDQSSLPSEATRTLDLSKYREIEQLSDMADLCQANGVRLIVIEMPGQKKSQNYIPVGPHIVDNYQLYNFNNASFCERFDDDAHWLGDSHLNVLGSETFTQALTTLIEF